MWVSLYCDTRIASNRELSVTLNYEKSFEALNNVFYYITTLIVVIDCRIKYLNLIIPWIFFGAYIYYIEYTYGPEF